MVKRTRHLGYLERVEKDQGKLKVMAPRSLRLLKGSPPPSRYGIDFGLSHNDHYELWKRLGKK